MEMMQAPVQLTLILAQNLKAGAVVQVDPYSGRFVAASLPLEEGDGPPYILLLGGLAGQVVTAAATTAEHVNNRSL